MFYEHSKNSTYMQNNQTIEMGRHLTILVRLFLMNTILVRLAELAKIIFIKSKVLPCLSLSLSLSCMGTKTSLLYNDFNDKYLLLKSTFHFQSLSNVSYLVAKCHTEKGFTLIPSPVLFHGSSSHVYFLESKVISSSSHFVF